MGGKPRAPRQRAVWLSRDPGASIIAIWEPQPEMAPLGWWDADADPAFLSGDALDITVDPARPVRVLLSARVVED